MVIRCGIAALLTGSVGLAGLAVARAEPFVVGAETWDHTARPGGDVFVRVDGTTVELSVAPTACAKLTRTSAATRYAWVPLTYWPQLDEAGGKVVLCLEVEAGTALATITPARGKPVGADLAPLLEEVVRSTRRVTVLPELGPVAPSLPPAAVSGNNLTFLVDGQAVGFGLSRGAHGTCAYENALVVTQLGTAADRPFADGYWPTVVDGKDGKDGKDVVYGCLDLREGYLTVVVNPGGGLGPLADVLAEVRRAAYAAHGAPITSDAEVMVLPHTEQRVTASAGPGRWKAVDGEPFKRPGADVLVSTAGLGHDGTQYAVAVSDGPCEPGTTLAAPEVASALFPSALGPVWIDAGEYKLRWTAWTCAAHDGATATIAVLAPLAHDLPPEAADVRVLRPLVDAVARSYAVDVPVPGAWSPGPARRGSGDILEGVFGGYVGVLGLSPAQGDRSYGLLFGLDLRVGRRGAGPMVAFDVELGRGGGEFIGELRLGGGLRLGAVEAVVGLAAGSTGPAAAADAYGQLGLNLAPGRSRLWLGAMHAIGWTGPNHDQLDAHLYIAGKDDTGLFLGGRAIWFGDSTDDNGVVHDNGGGFLVTFGGGAASQD